MLVTELQINNQIEIPSEIRNIMNIKPGQHFWISNEEGFIKLVPKLNINDLFGIAKGLDITFERDEEDRI